MSARDYRKGIEHAINRVIRPLEQDHKFFNDNSFASEDKAEEDYINGYRRACNELWDALQPVVAELRTLDQPGSDPA
jgi:hypothetical protein